MCDMHWKRWRKHGDPAINKRNGAPFWDLVDKRGPDECWPWKGPTGGRSGELQYGRYLHDGKRIGAHVFAWMSANGELPPLPAADYRGTCILHSCDFGLCCNPSHLFPGTHLDNMKDKKAKRRDTSVKPFCLAGHARTPENLYTSKGGLRACRACHRNRQSRYRQEQRTF